MAEQTVKTTIVLNQQLVYKAKMQALKQGTTLSAFMNHALEEKLAKKILKKTEKKKKIKIGGYKMGGITGTFRREEIYEDF